MEVDMDTVPWYNTSLDTNNQTTNYASIARIDADVRTKKQEFKSIDTKYSIICCFFLISTKSLYIERKHSC